MLMYIGLGRSFRNIVRLPVGPYIPYLTLLINPHSGPGGDCSTRSNEASPSDGLLKVSIRHKVRQAPRSALMQGNTVVYVAEGKQKLKNPTVGQLNCNGRMDKSPNAPIHHRSFNSTTLSNHKPPLN